MSTTVPDAALLLLRVPVGAVLVVHGVGKLTRLPGLQAASAWFESIGLRPGRVHALLAAGTEIAAGVGLVAGFLTPLAGAGLVALMLVAAVKVTGRRGFLAERGGWEYNGILLVIALFLAAAGPGRWSVDSAAGTELGDTVGFACAAGLGVLGALGLVLATRRPA